MIAGTIEERILKLQVRLYVYMYVYMGGDDSPRRGNNNPVRGSREGAATEDV